MKKLLFIAAVIFACASVHANNIQITNVSVVPANNSIKFDISWDNGWRSNTLNNWDAAWVFFKYKDAVGNWQHLFLTNTGNVIPSGFTGTVAIESGGPSGGVGAFLHRATVGNGSTILTNVELGILPTIATGVYDIKAFGIEMVYIPQAAFSPGDGVSANSYNLNYPVTSDATFIFDSIPSLFINSTTFPNGYNAFYCMKYELSQGGYRDFLNTLKYNSAAIYFSYNEQVAHTAVAPTSAAGTYALSSLNRNHIKIKVPAVNPTTAAVYGCDANNNGIYDEAGDGENIACNFLNWADHARFLIWAGLRPLTELEFEKAARGIQLPLAGEYAWGNTNIATTIYNVGSSNTSGEVVTNASTTLGNANYATTYPNIPFSGPLRNGIFATATSNRITSGASFYGVMDLSGNLMERVISTATVVGRNYTGVHGIGQYPTNFGIDKWPAYDAASQSIFATNPASGLIKRGGYWGYPASTLRVSDRSIYFNPAGADNLRLNDVGARGCRTAP